MKNVLKLELGKAMKTRYFMASILLGCSITLLSFFKSVESYTKHLQIQKSIQTSSEILENPFLEMFSLYNHWIGGEIFSMGTSIYFFVFPLLLAIPYTWSYCEEKHSGYARQMVVRCGKKTYYASKYIAVFLSGGLAMTLPLLFNFILTACVFPAVKPNVVYDTAYAVFGNSLMADWYYTKPLLYVACYLLLDFFFCGLLACVSITGSFFCKKKLLVMCIPMLVCLLLHYARVYFYTSVTAVYKEISPLYFLRPARTVYDADWRILAIETAVLFLATFIPFLFMETRHEIF